MAYSKAYEKRAKRRAPWPDLRYDPLTGDCKLFFSADEVPKGWVQKRPSPFQQKLASTYDRHELEAQLRAKGVVINPRWGVAHMKKVLDE